MKIALVAALLGQLAAQSPERIETKKLDIVGELNGKPGAEIVMYRGRPEKPGIDGHYDMTLGPGEKHNNVLVYEALSGPEAPYTELTINGHLMYARLIRGFQWQGTAIERMCIGQGKMPFKSKTPDDEWAEKEAPMLLMAEPGWQRVYFADETLVHPDWSRAGPTHPWHLDEGEKLYAQRLPGRRVVRRRLPPLTAWRALGGALISQDGTENNHFLLAPDRVFGARVEDAHAIKPKTERKRK